MTLILRLSLPLSLWLACFSAVYGLQGLACSRHWPPGLEARPVLVGAAALAILLQLGLFRLAARDPAGADPAAKLALPLWLTALVASGWTLLPTVFTTICG